MAIENSPVLKRTIIIGLGGAGGQIVTHLKRYFIDAFGVVPPCVKMLFLDTDKSRPSSRSVVHEKEIFLDEHEFLHLIVENPTQFIDSSEVVQKWFIKPVPIGSITDGAGAVRENGRLAFFNHINTFLQRMNDMTTELTSTELPSKMSRAKERIPGARTNFELSDRSRTDIYVCGSLAGGTGSGTFLDVGMILRDEMQNADIQGFFLLDWIYRNKAFALRVRPNVYAALTELDNMESIMYGTQDFVPYKMKYARREVEVKIPPYSLFHLVDGRNEYGENISDVGKLCATVANTIFLGIGTMGDPIASVADNLKQHINTANPKEWNGKYARYSSFGVSSLYYPARELHERESLANALRLCRAAISEIENKTSDKAVQDQEHERIVQDVENLLLTSLNFKKTSSIKNKLFPNPPDIDVEIEPSDMSEKSFPRQLEEKLNDAKNDLKANLPLLFDRQGFADKVQEKLNARFTELERNPSFSMADLDDWIYVASGIVASRITEISQDINQREEDVENKESDSMQRLDRAKKSRYIPFFGGPREKAVHDWEENVKELLELIREKTMLEFTRDFCDKILRFLGSKKPKDITPPSKVMNSLRTTCGQLSGMYQEANDNFDVLESVPNQIVIGYGNWIVLPEDKDNPMTPESIALDYTKFKQDNGINMAEDYLGKDHVPLFLDYCRKELNSINHIDIFEAMKTIGRKQGNEDEFITKQFDHLFRLSAALWKFDKSRLNEMRQQNYGNIINLGVEDKTTGQNNYRSFVKAISARYNLKHDPHYSTIHDPNRIWMVNYAAALPACFLSDMKQNRKKYYEEISPSYHIDADLEMNVPDLFPKNDLDHIALRILGMAIVSGIDVIHDEKQEPRGHKFTLDDGSVRKINQGDPWVWNHFKKMYDDIITHYDPKAEDNLLDIIKNLLREKVKGMDRDDLKTCISDYREKVNNKLATRDFSRLYSAKLTFQEIKELTKFLDRDGYALNIDRYIAGS